MIETPYSQRHSNSLLDIDEPLPLVLAPSSTRRALEGRGIFTYEQLACRSARALFDVNGIGAAGWSWLRELLRDNGLTMACGWPNDLATVRPPSSNWSATQGIYFLRGAGLVKIGLSECVIARWRELSLYSPIVLEPLGFIPVNDRVELSAMERALHAQFAADRAHGEWFLESLALAQTIAQDAQPWPTR